MVIWAMTKEYQGPGVVLRELCALVWQDRVQSWLLPMTHVEVCWA